VKGVAAALVAFEGIVVALAIPLAVSVSDVSASVAVPVGLALMLVCFVAAGLVRRSYGDAVAAVVQVLVLATGFVVPTMFLLGVIFGGLWVLTVVLGRKMAADLRLRESAAREDR
jgi:hypothetical protein